MSDELHNVANRACEQLPVGWRIAIYLELDSGTVTLLDPDDKEVEFPHDELTIDEQVIEAIEVARATTFGDYDD